MLNKGNLPQKASRFPKNFYTLQHLGFLEGSSIHKCIWIFLQVCFFKFWLGYCQLNISWKSCKNRLKMNWKSAEILPKQNISINHEFKNTTSEGVKNSQSWDNTMVPVCRWGTHKIKSIKNYFYSKTQVSIALPASSHIAQWSKASF